jgi:hypothetical protein
MLDKSVGRIKNIKYDPETNDMEIVICVTDNKFKKKILRDLSLSGKIKFEGDEILFTSNITGSIDGQI